MVIPAAGVLAAEQELAQRLCSASIRAPCVPYSTQRGEERRVTAMLTRCERSSQATSQHTHLPPFVLGQWRHLVEPSGGIRYEMHLSAVEHSKPVGTGLSAASMCKVYSREVRSSTVSLCV